MMDRLNLEKNNLVYKKNFLTRKNFSELLKRRKIHELGEMKRAPELRVDEFSASHDTTLRLN